MNLTVDARYVIHSDHPSLPELAVYVCLYHNDVQVPHIFVLCHQLLFYPLFLQTAEAKKENRQEDVQKYYKRGRNCNIALLVLIIAECVSVVVVSITLARYHLFSASTYKS